MGAILALVICVIGAIIFLSIGTHLAMDFDLDFWGIVCLVIGSIFIIASIIFAVNLISWIVVEANLEANIIANIETREMYITQLAAYEANRSNDVIASETYLNLYKEIVSFNKEVNKAATGSYWGNGLLWDPSYVGIEPIMIGGIK